MLQKSKISDPFHCSHCHFEENSLLANKQHGFRKNHSTVHAIAQVTSFINKKLDVRLPTIPTFIDFRKAFDCVQHQICYRREQHTLKFMYDMAQIEANLKPKPKTNVKTRSANKILQRVKCPRTEKFKSSLAYAGPKKWKALSDKFHHCQSKSAYKSMVRDWITLKAISSANEGSFLETTT